VIFSKNESIPLRILTIRPIKKNIGRGNNIMAHLTSLLILILMSTTLAFADDQPEQTQVNDKIPVYIAPLIGLSFPVNNATGGPYFTWGGEIGIRVLKYWNIGIFADTVSNSATVSGIAVSGNLTTLMLSLTAQFGILYYGGRLGIGIRSLSATSSGSTYSSSGSAFAVAPVVGVRIPVANNVSISAETSWQVTASGDISGTLGTLTLTSVGYIVPLVGATITF
jgi:hypothetical protein